MRKAEVFNPYARPLIVAGSNLLIGSLPLLGWFVVGSLSLRTNIPGFDVALPFAVLVMTFFCGRLVLRELPLQWTRTLLNMLLIMALLLAFRESSLSTMPYHAACLTAVLWGLLGAVSIMATAVIPNDFAGARHLSPLGVACCTAFCFMLADSGSLTMIAPCLAVLTALILAHRLRCQSGTGLSACPDHQVPSASSCFGAPTTYPGAIGTLSCVSMLAMMATWPLMQLMCGTTWVHSTTGITLLHLSAMFIPWVLISASGLQPGTTAIESWMAALMATGAVLAYIDTPAANMTAMLTQALAWSCSRLLQTPSGRSGRFAAASLNGFLAVFVVASVYAVDTNGIAAMRTICMTTGFLALMAWLAKYSLHVYRFLNPVSERVNV